MSHGLLLRLSLGLMALGLASVGTRAEDLATEDGKTYKDYKVVSHDDKGITIQYTETSTIPYDNLPPDLQKKFGHDLSALAAALEAKKAQEAAAAAADAKREAELDAQDQALNAQLDALKNKDSIAYAKLPQATISGQIFLAAQGGETFHFDGVHVGLVPMDVVNLWLPVKMKRVATELQVLQPRVDQARKDDDEALRERDASVGTDKFSDGLQKEAQTHSALDKVVDRRNYYSTGEFYADSLAPFYVTDEVTDLNGKFTVSAPRNTDFILVARVESRLGTASKNYFWFVKVHPASEGNTYILLDSENMASSGSPDSVVKTEDVPIKLE